MGRNRAARCLIIIALLSVAQVVLAAGNEELVRQLRADIDLLLWATGTIVAALITTIGVLWRSLRRTQDEFIDTLRRIHDKDD